MAVILDDPLPSWRGIKFALRGRCHLDFHTPDWAGLAARADGFGARRVLEEDGLVVFRSPGGLPFCVSDEDDGPRTPPALRWPGGSVSRVDQFCLDIPGDIYDAECGLWADLTGWQLTGQALGAGHEVVAVTRHPEQQAGERVLGGHGQHHRGHGEARGAAAGTAALDPGYRASDSVFFTRVMEPLFMRLPGRTLYADNRRMEQLIRSSGLDWTIVRACWLFDAAAVSQYRW